MGRFVGETMGADPYLVPGLLRGLEVLQSFTPAKPEQSLSDIAARLGISRSAAFRTVHTLLERGYLLPVGESRRFCLGPSVLRLSYGYHAGRELLEVARPALEDLRDATDWSAHLAVRDGRNIFYLLRLPSREVAMSIVHVGSRLPAATTAMGRLLLADLTEPEVRRLHADLGAARAEEVVRQSAADRAAARIVQIGTFESGIASVAAPIRDMSGSTIAAVSGARPATEVPDAVADAVEHAARAICRGLGGT